jgi:hypothetical protein
MKCKLISIALVILALAGVPAAGQAISGDVTGLVPDPSGAIVPGVMLAITNDQTGVTTTTQSDAAGVYRFFNLPIGAYTLKATAQGFGASTKQRLRVELSTTLTANIALQLKTSSTVVEVSDAAAGIDTTTAQLTASFDSRAVQDVPTAATGSGIYNLSLLGAGAASGGVGQGMDPAISGQRPENNTFNLDGVSNNNYMVTGALALVPNDAIAEMSLLQKQYSPEFGGGSGGASNAVVKSGTNQVHGSIYEYLQNRNLKCGRRW